MQQRARRDKLLAYRAALLAEQSRRRGSTDPKDDRRRAWPRSFAGRPVDFIGEIMGAAWWTEDWAAWRVFVKALFAQPMTDDELFTYCRFTGRDAPPERQLREAWLGVGRRGGKSRMLAMIGVYLACCIDWTESLAPGEIGVVRILSNTKPNAKAIMGYTKGALRHPKLATLVVKMLTESVELLGEVEIETGTASIGAVRSRTIIAALCVAAGTMIESKTGQRPIENIHVGDLVWTRDGLRRVLNSGMTAAAAKVYEVELSNNKKLIATAEHPVFVLQKGFVAVSSLQSGDEVLEWKQIVVPIVESKSIKEARDVNCVLQLKLAGKINYRLSVVQTAVCRLIDVVHGVNHVLLASARQCAVNYCHQPMAYVSLSGTGCDGTYQKMDIIGAGKVNSCTAKFTWRSMDLYHLGTRLLSITKIITDKILKPLIWKVCQQPNIILNTDQEVTRLGAKMIQDVKSIYTICGQIGSRLNSNARTAENHLNRPECVRNTVVINVRELVGTRPVYNLEVEDTPEYFANGILVHNCDEIAFWEADEESANPDREVLNALRPAMLTMRSAMILSASSVYARKGVLWDAYQTGHGKPTGPLFWKAATWEMRPGVYSDPDAKLEIDAEYEKDPISAAAEYGSEFRRDITAFVTIEALRAVQVDGRRELLPQMGVEYHGFTDPSGGSADSFTLAISHLEPDGVAVLDLTREVIPPFSPDVVVEEYANDLRRYGIFEVTGDAYAGVWPRERFEKHGVHYNVSEINKSTIYQSWLPLLNAQRCEILDDRKLFNQALNLERRTTRGGKDAIDHPKNSHDDLINAAAGALVLSAGMDYGALWTVDRLQVIA